jgi:hypothetical protein
VDRDCQQNLRYTDCQQNSYPGGVVHLDINQASEETAVSAWHAARLQRNKRRTRGLRKYVRHLAEGYSLAILIYTYGFLEMTAFLVRALKMSRSCANDRNLAETATKFMNNQFVQTMGR